jgi:hypothetical protein
MEIIVNGVKNPCVYCGLPMLAGRSHPKGTEYVCRLCGASDTVRPGDDRNYYLLFPGDVEFACRDEDGAAPA